MGSRGIEAETVRQLKPLQEVVVHLELAIEALALVLIQVIVENVVRVHHAIRCIVVTWRIERIAQIFQFGDRDITRSLHDSIIHVLEALTSLDEVVLLISVVHRRTECQVVDLMRTTGREGVLSVTVGVSRNDTVILQLRERYEVVALFSSAIERHTVRIAEASVEEVLHVVLNRQIRFDLLRVIVYSTILQGRAIEAGTPRTVLVVSLVTVPTHTEVVLHLRQTHHLLPLQTTVIFDTETFSLLLTTLGSDQDNTIGSTATIKSGSSSTFQDGHALHVVRVHSVSTVTEVITTVQTIAAVNCRVVHGYTINNIERLVGSAQRTDTTDDNRVRRTRVASSRGNLHTSHLTLEARHHVCSTCCSNLVAVNGCSRITQCLCRAFDTHGGHNHLVEGCGIALQEYTHAVLGRHRLRLIAEIRNRDLVLALRQSQREATIYVCQHTSTCSFYLDGSADDGLTVFL